MPGSHSFGRFYGLCTNVTNLSTKSSQGQGADLTNVSNYEADIELKAGGTVAGLEILAAPKLQLERNVITRKHWGVMLDSGTDLGGGLTGSAG